MRSEVWKPIFRFENYEISNFGNIRTYNITNNKKSIKPRLMKKQVDKDGYYRIALINNKKSYNLPVHRLVLSSFLGIDNEKPICNHKDGDKQNNKLSNLEWTTYSGNVRHAIDSGLVTFKYGSDHKNSKLTKPQALEIIARYNKGEKVNKFYQDYNVSKAQVYRILNGENWKNIDRSIYAK
jgi:hypothetical protein